MDQGHYPSKIDPQVKLAVLLTIKDPASSRLMDPVTLGITAQSPPRDLIVEGVYDLDVGSGHPNGAAAIKGSFVQ